MSRKLWIAIALVTCVACDKKEPAPADVAEKPTAAAVPAESPPTAAATPPAVDIDSLPVEEEFEATAEKELTSANLNAKLDELEKEISAP
jgi:hypothetical protein